MSEIKDGNSQVEQKPSVATPANNPLVAIGVAAAALGGISRRTIERLAKAQKIKVIKIGSRTFVPIAEVERIQREGTK